MQSRCNQLKIHWDNQETLLNTDVQTYIHLRKRLKRTRCEWNVVFTN